MTWLFFALVVYLTIGLGVSFAHRRLSLILSWPLVKRPPLVQEVEIDLSQATHVGDLVQGELAMAFPESQVRRDGDMMFVDGGERGLLRVAVLGGAPPSRVLMVLHPSGTDTDVSLSSTRDAMVVFPIVLDRHGVTLRRVGRFARLLLEDTGFDLGAIPESVRETAAGQLSRAGTQEVVDRLAAVIAQVDEIAPEEGVIRIVGRDHWDGLGIEVDVPWRKDPVLVWCHPEGFTTLFVSSADDGIRWGDDARDQLRLAICRRLA